MTEFRLKVSLLVNQENCIWLCDAMSTGQKLLFQPALNTPLSPGDVIAGVAQEITNDFYSTYGSNILLICTQPMILIGRDYDSVKLSLLPELKDAYVKQPGSYAQKCGEQNADTWLRIIYTCYAALDNQSVYPPGEELIIKAAADQKVYGDGGLKQAFKYALPSDVHQVDIKKLEQIPDDFIVHFLTSWYEKRFIRHLRCYGIEEKPQNEIDYRTKKRIVVDRSKRTLENNKLLPIHKVMGILLTNPFRVPFITGAMAANIATRINYSYTDIDIRCHALSFALHEQLELGYLAASINVPQEIDYETLTKYDMTEHNPGYAFSRVISISKKAIEKLRILHETQLSFSLEPIARLSEDQNKAITSIDHAGVVCITGAAGTGKSTVTYEMFKALAAKQVSVAVVAPTGKAADRVRRMGIPKENVSTIHKLLASAANYQVIIIDESSMVDISLLLNLLRHATSLKKLVMVGDNAQLPPVSWGTIFHSIISCQRFYVIHLTRSFRFEQDKLSKFINAVRDNQPLPRCDKEEMTMNEEGRWVMTRIPSDLTLFPIVQMSGGDEMSITILYTTLLKAGYKPIVLSHTRYSASRVNENIVKTMGIAVGVEFFPGQKVMATKGCKKYDISNGQDGIVESVTDRDVLVDFDGVKVTYFRYHNIYPSAKDLSPCYAMTIHKSQGNEWDCVILYLDKYCAFITKELMYTAISRARKMLFIAGNPVSFMASLTNNRRSCGVLDEMIIEE